MYVFRLVWCVVLRMHRCTITVLALACAAALGESHYYEAPATKMYDWAGARTDSHHGYYALI